MTSSERRRAPRLPRLLFLGLLASSLLSLLGMEVDWLNLASHFQGYLLLCWTGFLLLHRIVPRFRGAFWQPTRITSVGLVALLIHGLCIASLWWPPSHPDLEKPDRIDIVWFNMMFSEDALREFEGTMAKDLPDVIALGEIGPKTDLQLEGFPHRLRSPKHDILIASRFPLEHNRLTAVPGSGREQPTATVVVGRRRFRLVAVHFRQPVYPVHFTEFRIASTTAQKNEDLIMIGDFNSTPWSALFRHLLRDADLQHGREGRGILGSWSIAGNIPLKIGHWGTLPIDHMLYKGAIDLERFETLDWCLSDHRPLRGTFLIGTKRGRKARSDVPR
ncbi:MAG: endonuclease/exonuclease/phosphatase family protein [Planctomycetota bacterium]|jgi:endonuclease/exonuclease/phosphatase (EEP) superfamily protein YafD